MVHICLLAVIVMLSCFSTKFASAQQMPIEFLDLLASDGELKLSPEQATQVAGFYNKTDIVRLEGSTVDQALKAAIEAASEDGPAIDFANVTAQALKDSDVIAEYSIWLPHIDPESGFFYAYRVYKSPTASFPDVKRLVGAALARPDGSVLLVANNDEDHAIWQGLYKNNTIYLSYMEGSEAWDSTGTTLLEDQTVFSAVLEKVPVAEGFLNNLKESLPLQVNKDGGAPRSSASTATSAASGIFAAVLAVSYIVY
ncbi:hypothetical protein Ndes2526B_g00678 [Nannochloris sp. 'desiccata']|nr:hypothetical protein NADE_003830 [Chlorella desiccata (nom. nud.)]